MNMRTLTLTIALIACVFTPSLVCGEPPVAAKPLPSETARKAVYNESADANADIAAALARAQRNHTRVFVQWGANWCGWCKWLHEKCQTDRAIASALRSEYEVVLVDVGQFDKHLDLLTKFHANAKQEGIPYITVLDESGSVVTNQETSSLENPVGTEPKGHDGAKVLAFLKQHEAPRVDAALALSDAITKAKLEGKLVFVHFGAPWCGWCHRLEEWMAKPEVAAILSKAFVDVKIDTARMTGGEALLKAHADGKSGGIPWSEFLDAEGKALVNSNGPQGNIGFPAQAEEIAWFVAMLRQSKARLSNDEIAALAASLTAPAKAPH